MAKKAEIGLFRFVSGTGEIKKIIENSGIFEETLVLPEIPQTFPENTPKGESMTTIVQEITSPTVEGKPEKPQKGLVKKFVLENANFSTKNIKEEARRLFALSKEMTVKTTEMSLEQCFYKIRKERSEQKSEAKKTRKAMRQEGVKVLEEFLKLSEIAAVAAREILEENANLQAKNLELEKKLKDIRTMMRGI